MLFVQILFPWNLHRCTEFAWTHKSCMNARNLHGRMEFEWAHRICMDAQNLHGHNTEIRQVVELVNGGSVINGAYPI